MGGGSKYIREVDDLLTLEGLRIIYERNLAPHVSTATRATMRTTKKTAEGYTLSRSPRHAPPRYSSDRDRRPFVENYFNYFTEIEEHFQHRRGALSLLSPLDWALMEIWKDAGIPLEAVIRGIDASFEKWERRPKRTRKINGLAYCAQEVLAAAEEMKEAAVGGKPPEKESAGLETAAVIEFLRGNADELERAPLPESAQSVAAKGGRVA